MKSSQRQALLRKDPVSWASGKVVFESILAKATTPDALDAGPLRDVVYYVDGLLTMPAGGNKAVKALRAEARKRGMVA